MTNWYISIKASYELIENFNGSIDAPGGSIEASQLGSIYLYRLPNLLR